MTVAAFEVERDRVFFVDQSDMFMYLSFCVESFIIINTARHFFGKISNSPTKREIIEEFKLLLNTVPVGVETFLNHFHLGWKHENNVDGLIIFSAFPSQQSSPIEFSKILSNIRLDDTVSTKSLGPDELRKVFSDHFPNHSANNQEISTH